MIQFATKSTGAVTQSDLTSINKTHSQGILCAQNIENLNRMYPNNATNSAQQASGQQPLMTSSQQPMPAYGQPAQQPNNQPSYTPVQGQTPAPGTSANAAQIRHHAVPPLMRPVQKGQKVSIENGAPLSGVRAGFGWNTTNPECDVDVSAFLLGADGRVIGDSWFVFYGQTTSPDQSTVFQEDHTADCEIVSIDFQKLNPEVKKIVFVLTINDAFEKNLNFGMMKDAYVRILNSTDQSELVSFQMTEYYSNVISMMIGELYQHNGIWKFNAVGNGVTRDLAGLCELYGVEVSD